MTDHAQHIKQLELQLHIADYGMGMPRDYEHVKALRAALEQARSEYPSPEELQEARRDLYGREE